MLAVILVGHSFQATFWWSVAFTALAVLPAAMLPAAAQRPGSGAAPARRDAERPAGTVSRRVTVSRRGDGTATGQLASAQTVRPG